MLSRAASKGHLEVVNFLLERGAAVNLSGRGGMTPLHEAAGCGQVSLKYGVPAVGEDSSTSATGARAASMCSQRR